MKKALKNVTKQIGVVAYDVQNSCSPFTAVRLIFLPRNGESTCFKLILMMDSTTNRYRAANTKHCITEEKSKQKKCKTTKRRTETSK